MNVLIIGANGHIGQHLVGKIQCSDKHHAIAMVSKQECKAMFDRLGASTVFVDLQEKAELIAKAAKGADAVVYTASLGSYSSQSKAKLKDLNGAIKSMRAVKKAGVKRFILVSEMGFHKGHCELRRMYIEYFRS